MCRTRLRAPGSSSSPCTTKPVEGLGAWLIWRMGLRFGCRQLRANSPDGSTRIARMFQRRHRHRIIEKYSEPIAILSRMEQQDIRLPVSVQVAHVDKLPAGAGREQRWRLEGAVTVAR